MGLGQSLAKKISLEVGISRSISVSSYKFSYNDILKMLKKIDIIFKRDKHFFWKVSLKTKPN